MNSDAATHRVPPVSVVIASIVGPPFVDACLASVREQSEKIGAEVIVVVCGPPESASRLARLFPWIRVVHQPRRDSIPQLRRQGVEVARAPLVAIIEEHCAAAPGWLDSVLQAHASGNWAAVGGPVVDDSYNRLRDWVVYFCEYNGSLPPVNSGETYNLNGANIAYRKDVLSAHHDLLGAGYWEASLHPVLFREGAKFLSVPEMVVHHRGPFNYIYYLKQRFWFSRAFAGHRSRNLSLPHRAAYLLAAPVIPALLLARMSRRVFEKRCRLAKFAQTLPLIVPALTVYVAGEWVGYLAGPGNALSKVE